MNKIYFLLKILPFQYKEEFSSTAEIVQTIQTMTANLVKVMIINNITFSRIQDFTDWWYNMCPSNFSAYFSTVWLYLEHLY